MKQKIQEALSKLDPANDNHWTGDGLPRIETVKILSSISGVSRGEITDAAPLFTRSNLVLEGQSEQVNEQESKAETPVVTSESEEQDEDLVDVKPTEEQDDEPADESEPELEESQVVEADDVTGELAAVKTELEVVNKGIAKLQKKRNKILERETELVQELERETKAGNQPSATQGYLKSQRKLLQERGKRIQRMKDSGIDFKEIARLTGKAPIDAVRARQTGHGNKRPMR